MLYFMTKDGEIIGCQQELNEDDRANQEYFTRHDIESYEMAERIAEILTTIHSKKFLAVDNSEWVYPRYDVIEAPKVGDFVSYGFNGDYYPDSEIVSISESYKLIKTASGKKYYRRGQSAGWKYKQMWSMVKGHHNRWNPEF